jgi:hypothetical protein
MTEPDRNVPGPTGVPRWVKVFAAVALVVILLVVVLLLSGGEHGPGRHTASGAAPAHTSG